MRLPPISHRQRTRARTSVPCARRRISRCSSLAMIAGGTPPDVININSPLTLELDGMLVELTDKMSDLGYFDP